jgi:hypothetical protein
VKTIYYLIRCALAEWHDYNEARWRVFYMHHRMQLDAAASIAFMLVLLLGVLFAGIGYGIGHHGVKACGSIAAALGFVGVIHSLAGRH